jgi:hypothetical protein
MTTAAIPVVDHAGLLAVITGIAETTWGLGATVAFWEDDPNPMVSDTDAAQITLSAPKIDAVGVDEHRRHLSDGTDGYAAGTFWTLEVGNRKVMITIKAQTFNKGVAAAELVDAIRTGLSSDTVTAQLNALNLAFVWASNSVRIKVNVDERVVSTAAADFEFAGVSQFVSQVILPGVGGDYIASVNTNNIVPGTVSP